MTAVLTNSGQLAARRVRAFLRQPWFIAVTLVQPMIWLLLFGQLFKGVTTMPGFPDVSYIAFLTPGVVVMTAMFSNGWSGMSVITDLDRGVHGPVPRDAGPPRLADRRRPRATRGSPPCCRRSSCWPSAGSPAPGSRVAGRRCWRCGGGGAARDGLRALSNAIALTVRQEESVIGVNQFMVLPLAFLSSTLLPLSLAPSWIQQSPSGTR